MLVSPDAVPPTIWPAPFASAPLALLPLLGELLAHAASAHIKMIDPILEVFMVISVHTPTWQLAGVTLFQLCVAQSMIRPRPLVRNTSATIQPVDALVVILQFSS